MSNQAWKWVEQFNAVNDEISALRETLLVLYETGVDSQYRYASARLREACKRREVLLSQVGVPV
jgi:hypothetical protein